MPFKKGQSGNPGGRPKEKPFADALRLEIADAGEDHKALRRVARALLKKAEGGDIPAIRELADRLDGKPIQAVDANLDVSSNPLTELLAYIAEQPSNRLIDLDRH